MRATNRVARHLDPVEAGRFYRSWGDRSRVPYPAPRSTTRWDLLWMAGLFWGAVVLAAIS